MKYSAIDKRVHGLLLLSLAVLFFWAHWTTLGQVIATWSSNPDYSHGFLVVPLVAIMAKRRWASFPAERVQPAVGGFVLIALASMMRIVAARYYFLELDAWSLPLWIGGLVWLIAGWHAFLWTAPMLAYLWFGTPMPDRLQSLLSLPLQQIAAEGAAWILQALGHSAVALGTTLWTEHETLEVERACSGLRMFLGTTAMAVAFVMISDAPGRVRWIIMALAAPVAVAMNVLRIVATACVYQWTQDDAVRQLFHDIAGLAMVLLAWATFAIVARVLEYLPQWMSQRHERLLRYAALVPVALAAIGVLTVVWHNQQVKQMAQALLRAADRAEAEQNWTSVAKYLRRYLQFRPDDEAIGSRFALALDTSAENLAEQRGAFHALLTAHKNNPQQDVVAVALGYRAWSLREYQVLVETARGMWERCDAQERTTRDVAAVAPSSPDPAGPTAVSLEERKRLAARWMATGLFEIVSAPDHVASFGWSSVAQALERAVTWDPTDPQHAYRLALIYREHLTTPSPEERAQKADALVDAMVERNPQSAEAWLVRYHYRRAILAAHQIDAAEMEKIDSDLDRALAIDQTNSPRNVHVVVAIAERMRERGNLDASLAYYQQAIQVNPLDMRPYQALGEIWAEQGTFDGRREAADVLEKGLEVLGDREVALIIPLVERLIDLDRTDDAARWIKQARECLPLYPQLVRQTLTLQLEHVLAWQKARSGEFFAAAEDLQNHLRDLPNAMTQAAAPAVAQSWGTVGQYFRLAGDWQLAANAFQRAATLDESWRMEYRWAKARHAETSGELSTALREYQEWASSAEDPFEAWLGAASVALRQQLVLPETLRDWNPYRRALEAARAVAGERLDEVIVLEANQGLAMHEEERVLLLLRSAEQQFPNSFLVQRALALLQLRRGDFAGAVRTAERIPEAIVDVTDHVLLKAEIKEQAGELEEARDVFQHALAEPAQGDRAVWLVNLARLEMKTGQWDAARQHLQEAAQLSPHDLRVTEAQSQLAWALRDWSLMERCELELKAIEGDYGAMWRSFRIRRVLAQSNAVTQSPHEMPTEAQKLSQEMAKMFPRLQQTHIAAGRIASYRGLLRQAVANYEEAWELGVPRVTLAVDLISLLNELGETDRAQRYVHETRRYLSATHRMIDNSLIDLGDETADDAVRMARSLADEQGNSESMLRLGQTLVLTSLPDQSAAAERLAEAEEAFRRAVELAPADPRTWAALFRYLVAVRPSPVESQHVLQQLAEHPDITPLNRAFALAQLNESIGNRFEADRLYREAMALAAKHPEPGERLTVLERAAQFFTAIDPALAEQCCRDALSISDGAIGALEIQLRLRLKQPTEASLSEATKLLETLEQQGLVGDQIKRWRAEIHRQTALHLPDQRAASVQIALTALQELENKQPLDALRLSELYLMNDQWAAGMAELHGVSETLPQEIDELVRYLRDYGPTFHRESRYRMLAERILEELERHPVWAMQAIDLRLELAQKTHSANDESPLDVLELATVTQYARRALSAIPDESAQFDRLTFLFLHLIETDRIALARSVARVSPHLLPTPKTELALATAITQTKLRSADLQALTDEVVDSLGKRPASAETQFALANLAYFRGDIPQALERWRSGLRLQPNHETTVNNLALVRAVQDPQHSDESLRMLNEAIALHGRTPQLLDSLAVVHLLRGEPREAEGLLLEILPRTDARAVVFLHLARCWADLEHHGLARYALTMAESHGIRQVPLVPWDQEEWARLAAQLLASAEEARS